MVPGIDSDNKNKNLIDEDGRENKQNSTIIESEKINEENIKADDSNGNINIEKKENLTEDNNNNNNNKDHETNTANIELEKVNIKKNEINDKETIKINDLNNNIITDRKEIEDENVLLINSLKEKNFDTLKRILSDINEKIDINKLYDGKTIISTLIENIVNDEELFNNLFDKGAYIESEYLRNNKTESSKLIEKNKGLIKSIIKNGFYIKNLEEKIVHIATPVIYFIRGTKNGFVEILLDNGASIEETDEDGTTPMIQTVKIGNTKLFKLLLNKYHPDIHKKNQSGQTLLSFVEELDKNKDNKRD
eukprot:jgi/Orpsp1_1/1174055/evm.model.c7180000048758.1